MPNPTVYRTSIPYLKTIDEKLKYSAFYFNQHKEDMLRHGKITRVTTHLDFKEKVSEVKMKNNTLPSTYK